MFEAMERGELKALYVIGENPAQSEADQHRAGHLLDGLDVLVVQDVMFTGHGGAWPTWCCRRPPARSSPRARSRRANGACSACAAPSAPAGESRDDLAIIFDLARHMGADWGPPDAERVWNELRDAVAGARRA